MLKVEDPNFYKHHGLDFWTPGAGWTTITQKLANKIYFYNYFNPGPLKIKQTLFAWLALEPLVSKKNQLNLFLNIMYYGNGVTGLKDAAEYYFQKKVSDLTEDQYIALIASLNSPIALNFKDHPRENALRVARIKKLLSGAYKPRGLLDITYEGADR